MGLPGGTGRHPFGPPAVAPTVSPNFRWALLLALAPLVAAAQAPPPVAPFDCNGEICTFNVTADALVTSPCQGLPVVVASSRLNGATLVQCSTTARTEDNLVYVFDRTSTGGRVYEVEGGRYVNLTVLTQAATDGVPAPFGPVPLCSPPGAPKVGELTLVVKEPSGGGDHPYCYRLYRASTASGALALTVDGASAPAPAIDGRARWNKLVAALLPSLASATRPAAPVGVGAKALGKKKSGAAGP